MGAEEGLRQAVGQIDAILAEDDDSTTPTMTTHTLDVPGATLTYDVRRNGASTEPVLLLIGSPMGAAGFGTLSQHFSDRTVATYDPRGVERSVKADVTSPVTPDVHGDDLHRLIQAIGGPVDLFASSGGAVNALALVSKHPEDVRTLVAHEPPLASILPDREHAMAVTQAVHDTYQRSGWGAGMALFITVVNHQGPITAEIAAQPAPDPAMFGMPAEDDGSRTDPLLGQNIVTCTHYEPDFDALRSASTRIVLAAGEKSEGQMANRGASAGSGSPPPSGRKVTSTRCSGRRSSVRAMAVRTRRSGSVSGGWSRLRGHSRWARTTLTSAAYSTSWVLRYSQPISTSTTANTP
jgi:pimeloyl-ACP methyl ester carboxylesterase